MPHKDGKIYTETRNGVKYGVSDHDVAATIGAASLDVGTLCTHPNITVGAMYKPFICDTPAPPTMAQRRGAQYGIYIPTAAIRSTSLADDKGNTPPRWRHIPPSGNEWKRLDDFEGYSHNAPIPVETTVRTSNGSVHVDFKFNGTTENGGIAPSVLDVINVGTMSDLYPGFALYAPDGKNHTFKYVATSPVKIGSQKSLSMDFPVSSLGNGFFEVFPILSPKPYSSTHSPAAGDNHLVVFADGVMTTFDFYDIVTGTPLLTRRYIGTEYYTRIGAAIIDRAADGAALPDYRVQFLTNNYLQLTPTPAFRTLAAKDNRIMVNLEFVYSNTGYSGLKDWIPIKGGITSLENFNAIRGTTYAYALCRWSSATSEDIMLVLKYEFDSNIPASWNSTGWQIGFRRSLAIVDEGREIWTGVYGNSITVKGTSAGVNSVTGTSLERIRFGNTVSGNSATENTATGLYLQANDLSATKTDGNLAIKNDDYGELFFNSVNIEGGNVTNNTGSNRIYQVTRMPVATEVYLDISVDTAETQDESLNWLNA